MCVHVGMGVGAKLKLPVGSHGRDGTPAQYCGQCIGGSQVTNNLLTRSHSKVEVRGHQTTAFPYEWCASGSLFKL